MKLTVLVDNNTYIDRYYRGEPAFCCLIEEGAQRILFDTGYSSLFMDNADAMGLSLSDVTDIVLSHGHNDHTGGLFPYLKRYPHPVRLYAHPFVFASKRSNGLDIGVSGEALPESVTWIPVNAPHAISPHVLMLGEIPRIYEHESARGIGERLVDGRWEPDLLSDDTALVLLPERDASVLLTGCAHSGICNTLAYAISVTEQTPNSILGGMHLLQPGAESEKTLACLQALGIQRLFPAHCTALAVKAKMCACFDVQEVGVGLSLQLQ